MICQIAAHLSSLPSVPTNVQDNTNFIKHTAIFDRTSPTNDDMMMDGIINYSVVSGAPKPADVLGVRVGQTTSMIIVNCTRGR